MSKVPIAGQPSLSPKANGMRLAAFILPASAVSSSSVVGRSPVVGREDALAIEDGPRVVVDRHEILLAVVAGRGDLERVAEVTADLAPDVADIGRQTLGSEEPHPESGEPREHVVRGSLEVGVELVLERAVVHRVDLDGDTRFLVNVSTDAWSVAFGTASEAFEPRVTLPAAADPPPGDAGPQATPRAGTAAKPAMPAAPLRTSRRVTARVTASARSERGASGLAMTGFPPSR